MRRDQKPDSLHNHCTAGAADGAPEPADRPHAGAADPLDELIDSEPASFTAAGQLAMAYIEALEDIVAAHPDDPLLMAEDTLIAGIRLVAGLSPAGSAGPSNALRSLLEAVMEMRRGKPPALLRAGPPRSASQRATPPSQLMGRALAAAVVTLLMERGVRRAVAVTMVASRLRRIGIAWRRRDGNPARTIERWREQASGADIAVREAYQVVYADLVAAIAPLPTSLHQQRLLRALDIGAARGLFRRE